MKVRAIAFSAFLLAAVSAFSQENETKENIRYSNITEGGFIATSPKGFGFEATTVNGFSMNKQHCLGLGLGFGYLMSLSDDYFYLHMPVYFNYRLYFNPEKSFTPHLNIALGGVMIEEGGGLYSAVTLGFKVYKFSFSSGISFMAINGDVEKTYERSRVDPYSGYTYTEYYSKTVSEFFYPFGFTLKCGFSF